MDNVIIANFNGHLHAVTDPLWRYDEGMRLQFEGVDLPAAYQVHFANEKDGDALVAYGDEAGAEIPYELLEDGYNVYAWVYVTGDGYGRTKYVAQIPVMIKARPSEEEPSPAQQSALDEAINAVNGAAENLESATANIPNEINAALEAAKESGEFDGADGADGADGNSIWRADVAPTPETVFGRTRYYYVASDLSGAAGRTVQIGDLVVKQADVLYYVRGIWESQYEVYRIGSIKGDPGEDGFSPVVTITEIEGGHRVTITDEDHPTGQSFDVMDGQGGSGGTSDYSDLTNKPQIEGVTLSGNKTASDLGLAKSSDIPTVPSAYTSTPADLGTASAGSSTSWAKGDHVHKMPSAADVGAYALPSGGIPASDLAAAVQTSLGKADTALQSFTETDPTVPSWAKASTKPTYTASDVGAVAVAQGVAHAGEFVVVGSDGNITTVTMSVWQGGSY